MRTRRDLLEQLVGAGTGTGAEEEAEVEAEAEGEAVGVAVVASVPMESATSARAPGKGVLMAIFSFARSPSTLPAGPSHGRLLHRAHLGVAF